ncbi:hypothetical protein ACWGDT_40570 [Streptomyces avermitilis]
MSVSGPRSAPDDASKTPDQVRERLLVIAWNVLTTRGINATGGALIAYMAGSSSAALKRFRSTDHLTETYLPRPPTSFRLAIPHRWATVARRDWSDYLAARADDYQEREQAAHANQSRRVVSRGDSTGPGPGS